MYLTVAVCDDEPMHVCTLVSYIQSFDMDYKVEIIDASNGKELLNKLEKKKVNIVFLDIEGIDGIGLGRKIRKKHEDCIIVFITGFKDYALEAFDIDKYMDVF